jgi:hypothetical protein
MLFYKKRIALAAVALGLMAAMTGRAQADVQGFASDARGDLLSVNLTTATATVIGNTGLGLVEGLALDANGNLYATDANGTLYTLSTTTGAVISTIGSTGLGNIEGLAFSGNSLIATNFNSNTGLYSLNTTTATPTLIAATNPSVGVVRAMTVVDATSARILVGSSSDQSLQSLDLITGATSLLGPINPISGFSVALASGPGGSLYSLDTSGNAYSVSPTGNYTLIGNTGSYFYLDLTISAAAVPEPSSVVLCGIAGVVALAAARARCKREIA